MLISQLVPALIICATPSAVPPESCAARLLYARNSVSACPSSFVLLPTRECRRLGSVVMASGFGGAVRNSKGQQKSAPQLDSAASKILRECKGDVNVAQVVY